MEPPNSQSEGTFGTFLELLRAQKGGAGSELEDAIVEVLSFFMKSKGELSIKRLDQFIEGAGYSKRIFLDAVEVMLHEGILQNEGDRVLLSPEIRARL